MNEGFRLGFVEGFYGRPWSWAERRDTAGFLAGAGYGFYLYAPKGDAFLRRRWRESWTAETRAELTAFGAELRARGLEFGVGLSPHEFHLLDPAEARSGLLRKADEIATLGVDHLALLFDDLRGDLPGLAERQAELAHAVRDRRPELRLSLCPTYYSDDPVLDRLFGPRPPDYLERLGQALDPAIELFWTGARICSREYSVEELRRVGERVGRKLLLWDNYPVNDTEAMCRFLHLRSFTGRPAGLREVLSGHLVNPMHQPMLSRIPALTLAGSYRAGDRGGDGAYEPGAAFRAAAAQVLGGELALRVERDLELFQDRGRESISPEVRARLIEEYGGFAQPGAAEIAGWLRGEYVVTRETLREQL